MNAFTHVPPAENEPVLDYAPGSPERAELKHTLDRLKSTEIEIPLIIGGEEVRTGNVAEIVMPHDHGHVLGRYHIAGPAEIERAIEASQTAWQSWSRMAWNDRAAIFLRAAELAAGAWRQTLNASTMLGQSKTAHQAEIDAACEFVDFLRWNLEFAEEIYAQQPVSAPGMWNRSEYRPLEGFIYAVSPFNFTSIGGNLCTAPASMGNVIVWKPSFSAVYSNHFMMKLLAEAGLPAGVINFVPGDPEQVTEIVMGHPDFAGLHFTGSTDVFRSLWAKAGNNLARYRNFPRIVGETGGKDFIIALTPVPTPMRSSPPSSAAPLSIRVRSARPPHVPTFREASGSASATTSSSAPKASRWVTPATFATSWAPSFTKVPSASSPPIWSEPRRRPASTCLPEAPATTAKAGSCGPRFCASMTRTTRPCATSCSGPS